MDVVHIFSFIVDIFKKAFEDTFSEEEGDRVKVKLNLYTLLQLFWVFEINYLLLNIVFYHFPTEIKSIFIGKETMKVIDTYNKTILEVMEQYSTLLLILAIMLFIVNIFVSLLVHAYFSRYITMMVFADYGLYAASWLSLMALTYLSYKYLPLLVIVAFILAFVVLFRREKSFSL